MKDVLKKATHQNWVFWICLGISVFLIVGGALTPPPFVIDNSIFIGVGELFAFASLGAFLRALEKGTDARIKKGDVSVEIGDLNKPENQSEEE